MAEGLLRHLSHGAVEVFSAGSHPSSLHPYALRAMNTSGIDISQQQSKHMDEFRGQSFDYIITVCDRMRDVCPPFSGDPALIHWSFPDPVEKVAARTGFKDAEAASVGFDPLTVESTFWDHKVYYPGAHEIRIRVTGDRRTSRLLGAQMVGHVHGEIAKWIDIFATALFHEMSIDVLFDLELSYTPPLSSPWDPVQMSAQAWQHHAKLLSEQAPRNEQPQPVV